MVMVMPLVTTSRPCKLDAPSPCFAGLMLSWFDSYTCFWFRCMTHKFWVLAHRQELFSYSLTYGPQESLWLKSAGFTQFCMVRVCYLFISLSPPQSVQQRNAEKKTQLYLNNNFGWRHSLTHRTQECLWLKSAGFTQFWIVRVSNLFISLSLPQGNAEKTHSCI